MIRKTFKPFFVNVHDESDSDRGEDRSTNCLVRVAKTTFGIEMSLLTEEGIEVGTIVLDVFNGKMKAMVYDSAEGDDPVSATLVKGSGTHEEGFRSFSKQVAVARRRPRNIR